MHCGENGILKRAEYATDKYQNKAEQEQNELAKIDDYIQNGRETVTISKEEYENLKNANKYSTTEQVAGTWIDGKPLYRKVITGLKSPSKIGVWKDLYTESNAEMLMVEKLLLRYPDGRILELNYYNSAGSLFMVSGNTVQVYADYSDSYTNKDLFLIINYTKTTDEKINN